MKAHEQRQRGTRALSNDNGSTSQAENTVGCVVTQRPDVPAISREHTMVRHATQARPQTPDVRVRDALAAYRESTQHRLLDRTAAPHVHKHIVMNRTLLLAACTILAPTIARTVAAQSATGLRFEVAFPKSTSARTGRAYVAVARDGTPEPRLQAGELARRTPRAIRCAASRRCRRATTGCRPSSTCTPNFTARTAARSGCTRTSGKDRSGTSRPATW